MSKPVLLYHPDRASNFRTATHFETLWDEYFIREPIDFSRTYDSSNYIITVNHLDINEDWYKTYIDNGFRMIVDNLWDNPVVTQSTVAGNVLTLRAPNWAWFNEALWYIEKGYDKVQLNHTPTKFFLMPMRIKRLHRDQLLRAVTCYLDKSTYSYTSQGVMLDNDLIIDGDVEQRFINPQWFESTAFSLVAEAMIHSPTFLSEKTFKPMAFNHPFVVWGSANTLAYLHAAGFETFDHTIDETYDTITDAGTRLASIVDVIDQLYTEFDAGHQLFADAVSQEKIAHNRSHFYNKELLIDMFTKEVINPMLDFIQ